MTKPPAFQFYPDDFLGGVSDMTQAEVGAYILLLCHQWNCGKISEDKNRLSLTAKGDVSDHVFSKFPNGKNRRLERERKKQRVYREKQRINGTMGGRPAKPKPLPSLSSGLLKSKPKITFPSPSPSSNKDIPAIAGEHKAFIDGWSENFKAQFGFDYAFDGGRDARAVKDVLRTGILRIDLLEIAKEAWKHQTNFACRQASTIHGFRNSLNPIRTELKNGNHTKPNPRNAGVVGDLAENARRTAEFVARQQPKPAQTHE